MSVQEVDKSLVEIKLDESCKEFQSIQLKVELLKDGAKEFEPFREYLMSCLLSIDDVTFIQPKEVKEKRSSTGVDVTEFNATRQGNKLLVNFKFVVVGKTINFSTQITVQAKGKDKKQKILINFTFKGGKVINDNVIIDDKDFYFGNEFKSWKWSIWCSQNWNT